VPSTVLAVDTATPRCSVALAVDGRIVEIAETVGQRHTERVLPMVQSLLRGEGRRLDDCDAIAFGAGPGAFTGLRIACGVAQGLAFGVGKPVVAVGNLEALALAASHGAPAARRVLAAIDARMQEIYWAAYDVEAGRLLERHAPALAAAADLPALCEWQAPDLVAGNAVTSCPAVAAELRQPTAAEAIASAATIARLALARLAAGRAVPPAQAAPIYVRDRVALTVDERRAAARA
jgi:tRNA threonylcarbamoyladenosine biosynthesis protein TsaB